MPSVLTRLGLAALLGVAGFGTAVWLVGRAAASGGGTPTLVADSSFNGGHPVLLDFPAPSGGSGPSFQGASGVARLASGKVVVAGYHSVGQRDDFDVARLNANGTIDTTFGTNGYAHVDPAPNGDNTVFAMALQPDGKIVLAGIAQGGGAPEIGLARLTANGAPDSTFGSNGVVVDPRETGAFAVAIDSNGRIDVDAGNALLRYTPTGAIDSSFGSGGASSTGLVESRAMLIQPDGKIVLAGSSTVAGKSHATVERFGTTGALDSGFGTSGVEDITPSGGNEFLNTAALQGTSILVGGASAAGSLLARLTSAGKLDTSFGTAGRIVDPTGDAVNALLYVPKPQDVSGGGAKSGTTTTGQECQSEPGNGDKIKCTPATTNGGNSSVDAMTETCGATSCTIDAVGQDSNTGKATVTQQTASDGGGTTSTTTTTTTPACAVDPSLPSPCADLDNSVMISGEGGDVDSQGVGAIPTSAKSLAAGRLPTILFTIRNRGPNNSPGGTLSWTASGFPGNPAVVETNPCVGGVRPKDRGCKLEPLAVSQWGNLYFDPLYGSNQYFPPGAYSITLTAHGTLPDPNPKNDVAPFFYYLYNQQKPSVERVPPSEPDNDLSRFSGGLLTLITGKSSSTLGSKLAALGRAHEIQVAVLQLAPGVTAGAAPAECRWLASASARFVTTAPTNGVCDKQHWLTATGTTHWAFVLTRHLPAASYVFYVRVIDGAGNPSFGFTKAAGTRQRFTLTSS